MRTLSIVVLCVTGAVGCSSSSDPPEDGRAASDRSGSAGDRGTADQGAKGDQASSAGPHGSCAGDAAGLRTCTEYVGSGFAPGAALDAARAACTQSSGSWSDAACPRDGMQGYCTWLEGQPTEERHFYYDFPTDALNQAKVDCESVDGHRWHRT